MFSNLSAKLEQIFKKLRGYGRLSESDVSEALREVRLALLEADVHFRVVKSFLERVKERAVGREVLASLTPGHQVIKVVHEELTALMGEKASRISFAQLPPTAIMLVGLHGSGKTTTAGKLARLFQGEGRRPLLVVADPYRPAAGDQLKVLGNRLGVEVYHEGQSAVEVCRAALSRARKEGFDVLLADTAGRLHIDQELMDELRAIKEVLCPTEVLLVADAMTGQDAVKSASAFDGAIGLTGVILTKLDGDTRGGAALSIKAVTGKPIKFVGVGEKLDALEVFHPERLASRILGMGDVLSLVEKAEAAIDIKKAAELAQRLQEAHFTLEDFREQLRQIRDMGPLDQLFSLIPGLSRFQALQGVKPEGRELVRMEAIINSMTAKERRNPRIIDGSRRRRIAQGSGTTVSEVNRLLKQFHQVEKLITHFTIKGKGAKGMRAPFPFI